MEKQIARIRYKMIGVVALIACLATWQREFIIGGVMSHVEMNSTILLTFAFSIVMAFIFVFKLKNEIVAFKALREMWDDIRMGPVEETKDPLWRHYRCAQPARVFYRPRLLGHAYDLVTEELARTKRIRISVETMNTLVHKIEQTINDEKSLLVYLSGLLVFMGLIGTFIGLLTMVSSIGGIIGSLAGSAGGAGAAGAFAELLGALQQPLKGMASGFASSLFGLFSSLVVGLLARFAGQAAGVLKGEFESWLAGLVEISDAEYSDVHVRPEVSAPTVAAPNDPALIAMVGDILSDYARISGSFDRTAQLIEDMRTAQISQSNLTERLVGEMVQVHKTQNRILEEIASVAPIAPALRELGSGIEAFGSSVTRRLEADVSGLRELISAMDRSNSSNFRMISANHVQTTTQLAGAMEQLSADIDRRTAAPSSAMLEETLDRSVRTGLGEIGRVLAGHTSQLESRASKLAEAQHQILNVLTQMSGERMQDGDSEKLRQSFETSLTNGFARVSQTMETAFSAYSGLLHISLAALKRADSSEAASLSTEAAEGVASPDQGNLQGKAWRAS